MRLKTIVFVHGTGVRGKAYRTTLDQVRAGVASIRPGWQVQACCWGDEHGARLNANGVTIPRTSDRGLTIPEGDSDVDLWWMLEHDSLFELRSIAMWTGTELDLPPNADVPADWVEAARDLPDKRLAALLDDAGLSEVFSDAVSEVLADDACQQALSCGPEVAADVAGALARAFLAQCLHEADRRWDQDFPLDGDTRKELVDAIKSALEIGSDRGVGNFAFETVMRAGGSRAIDRRRAVWSSAAAPAAGDVLYYLTRGNTLRGFIANRIADIDTPVVVLAHSLGGIAALELLIERELPNVEQLVTVGSQAPLLYELNALPTLAYGTALPGSVPDWINIYDQRDLLAYVGSGVFPGRVRDLAVDNRAPFPRAHSAYFARKNKRFYKLLDQVLP